MQFVDLESWATLVAKVPYAGNFRDPRRGLFRLELRHPPDFFSIPVEVFKVL